MDPPLNRLRRHSRQGVEHQTPGRGLEVCHCTVLYRTFVFSFTTLFWELYMINSVQLVSLDLSIYALASFSFSSSSSPNLYYSTLPYLNIIYCLKPGHLTDKFDLTSAVTISSPNPITTLPSDYGPNSFFISSNVLRNAKRVKDESTFVKWVRGQNSAQPSALVESHSHLRAYTPTVRSHPRPGPDLI